MTDYEQIKIFEIPPYEPPLPATLPLLPPPPGIPHGAIAIDGNANFSATALLKGWPGDGSPENPFIINGLEIDLNGAYGSCIAISNTQVSFIIRNCNLTGASGSMQYIPNVRYYYYPENGGAD